MLWDAGFINGHMTQRAGRFIVLQRVRLDRAKIHIATEVSTKIAEIGSLFNNWAALLRLIPPVRLSDLGVGACVPRSD